MASPQAAPTGGFREGDTAHSGQTCHKRKGSLVLCEQSSRLEVMKEQFLKD